jgi:PAS domain S-box-containing protein
MLRRSALIQPARSPVRDEAAGAKGTGVDPAGPNHAVAHLLESEQWLKAIFDRAAVGMSQVDAKTRRFVRVNQKFCDLVGYTSGELQQLSFPEITYPEDVAMDAEKLARLTEGSITEFTREKRYVRKNGSVVWVTVAVSSIGMPGDAPVSYVVVAQDVTERKRIEEHFNQAQKMEALGQFSGGVAHDFNNILAAIVGYTELAGLILDRNPEVRGHLDQVLAAANRAADLVQQILTFSQRQPRRRRMVHLRPIVAECLKLLRAALPATIEIDASIGADAPPVMADANQIRQIIMNLGTNASHAMKDRNGRLKVTLERCVVDASHAAAEPRLQSGVYARVSVGDNGCGMDPGTLPRIFEPFFTTRAPGEGTGLGLAVVHGIMDDHDGVITVSSHPGEGSIFHLYFPAGAADVIFPPIERSAPVRRGRGERILVVDDEEQLAALGRKTLTALGYEVEVATLPTAALAMVHAAPDRFAVVLTDQTMPGMTGLVLANRLRQIRADLPIILMTGFSASITSERAEEAGIQQILLKPVTIHSLGSAVHDALASQQLI